MLLVLLAMLLVFVAILPVLVMTAGMVAESTELFTRTVNAPGKTGQRPGVAVIE